MVVVHASLLAIEEKAPLEYILWPKWSESPNLSMIPETQHNVQ